MQDNVQKRLNDIRNELKAQKTSYAIEYGPLSNSSRATRTDTVDLYNYNNMPRWVARFTRTDSKNTTPFVQFVWNYSYSPTYRQYLEGLGYTVNANDLEAQNDLYVTGCITEVGDNYVEFAIDMNDGFMNGERYVNITIEVEALSPVYGNLTLEKVR